MRNHKAMKYFSGSAFQRLPLYKLAMGGVAVLLCAGIGVSTMAAAFIGAPPAEPVPTVAEPVATFETATPSPTPAPTPAPEVEVYSEISILQQNIGVQLYSLVELPDEEAGGETAQAQTIAVQAADTEATRVQDGKKPLTGVAMDITIQPVSGDGEDQDERQPLVCPVDTETGTLLAEDVAPGEYTIVFPEVEGYRMPEDVNVTVNEKVEYKADVEAVKDKIVQADEVVESQEDNSYGGDTVVQEEIVDTVAYADSNKVETSRTTVYTAKLSGDGHLLLKDGSATGYLPVYDENNALTGARRETSAASLAAGARLTGLGGLLRHGAPEPGAEATPDASPEALDPLKETTPAPETTAAPDATAEPAVTPTPVPEATPTPAPEVTPTPAPTPEVAPTPAPPTATPAPSDPTAGWPNEIAAAELANYGFDVSATEQITYEYTGWQTINGKQYYYDPATHQPVTGSQVIQGNVYEFAADGALNQTARGIDVSKYQGNIDWNAVAADGITFAIIRVGYRGYGSGALVEDSTFRRNIAGATAAGLKVGVYFYSQAVNEAEAVEEASMVISLCQGYGLPLGVYYDTEKVAGDTGRADNISAAERTACAVAFCETIRNAGYTAGVYSYASWFYNSLNYANISKYNIWIAQYRDTLDFNYRYDIWQYTSTGRVDGVPGGVDMNIG